MRKDYYSRIKPETDICCKYWNRLFEIYGFDMFECPEIHSLKPLSVKSKLKHANLSCIMVKYREFMFSKYEEFNIKVEMSQILNWHKI